MDPALNNFMSNLKRQAVARKLNSLAGVGKEKVVVEEVAPTTTVVPPTANRKRGRSPKVQIGSKVGQSSGRPLIMLSPSMRVAQAMQFNLRPEDEGVLVAIPTKDLIEELVELQSRATIVGKALSDELSRAKMVVMSKLKAELEESASSLKAALEAAEACREEMRKNDRLAKEEQETLKATLTKLMAERDHLLKEKTDAEARGQSLTVEVEKCQ